MARPFNAPDVFRAVAHPVRRRMLDLLKRRSCPAAELTTRAGVSRPTASEHLRVLRMAGLVQSHDRGVHRFYRLSGHPLRQIDAWIRGYRQAIDRP